jgi:hypothetical protein
MLKFMKKINPFIKKDKNICEHNHEYEPSQEAIITLHLSEGELNVSVDWTDDLDIRYIGALLGSLAVPHIFNLAYKAVFEHLHEVEAENLIPVIDQTIREKIELYREATGEDEPIVSPENAIRWQMTMYQS